MSEAIYKLQPDRTLHLRGFDDRGAAGALHSASATGFEVSGVFRDPADFCVLMLWDSDDFFEHPRFKYLPHFDFSGMVLTFDVLYEGLQPLDSDKFPTIPWDKLQLIREDGTAQTVSLFPLATLAGGTYTAASASLTVTADPAVAFDRVTLWFQNYAFDYIASGGESAEDVAADLAAQINAAAVGLAASVLGAVITVRATKAGRDGNMIRVYAQSKTSSLRLLPATAQLAGGSSAAVWRVSLDFTALGLTSPANGIRQMWLTFAPPTADAQAFSSTEWRAIFTNWSVTDPLGNRRLRVAGPGSVRVEEYDRWCTYSGSSWGSEAGFYSRGFARRAVTAGDAVTVRYHCQHVHDLYVGTSLYTDRGAWGVSLDGDAATILDCRLANEPAVNTRRRVRAGVAAGRHEVTLTADGAGPVYLDFVEAVVAGDVPDAAGDVPDLSPAIDYDTDHTYKLSPQRLMWNFDKLGFSGPMNLYVGVFWWNQRTRSGAVFPAVTLNLDQVVYASGDGVFVDIGGSVFGKTVFPADTPASIARHFAYFINQISTGVWAEASGNFLTVRARAIAAAYEFTFRAWMERTGVPDTEMAYTGALSGGTAGSWVIDTAQTPTLNRGARDWLADYFEECALRGRETVVAYSMELVNPPAGFAALYPDGTVVETATGFGTLTSTHCSFNALMTAYQQRVYRDTADLMAAAGIPVALQFGEFVWWFFAAHGGMGFYDADTAAAASAALGRPLQQFATPTDDPAVNGGADVAFLQGRLESHMAAIRNFVRASHPSAEFEILLPLDVLYPEPVTAFLLGGRLNHAVSLPDSFRDPATAPFDRVKMEALAFGGEAHDLNLARIAMRFPFEQMNWPKSLCRYLFMLTNRQFGGGGLPWERELLAARQEQIPALVPFAFDHQSIFGWPVEEPVIRPSAALV